MTLQEAQAAILEDRVDRLLIFNCGKSEFIPLQYARHLAQLHELEIKTVDSLDDYYQGSGGFGMVSNTLYLYRVDCLEEVDPLLTTSSDIIIIAKKIKKDVYKDYAYNIVDVPDLEPWHVHNYIQGICGGLTEVQAQQLAQSCKYDLFKIDQELAKLRVFAPAAQAALFDVFTRCGLLGEAAEETIFDLTNAIQARDINKIKTILSHIGSIDVEPVGLVTVLSNNFKKLIKVWLAKNPTEASIGLKNNQIWAINRQPHTYSKEQLLKVLKTINEVEYKLKSGEIPENLIIDYLITSTLTA